MSVYRIAASSIFASSVDFSCRTKWYPASSSAPSARTAIRRRDSLMKRMAIIVVRMADLSRTAGLSATDIEEDDARETNEFRSETSVCSVLAASAGAGAGAGAGGSAARCVSAGFSTTATSCVFDEAHPIPERHRRRDRGEGCCATATQPRS